MTRELDEPRIEIPDLIEPFVGWRCWRYSMEHRALVSMVQYSCHWPGMAALEAECLRAQVVPNAMYYGFGAVTPHETVPYEECKCGIWGCRDIETVYKAPFAESATIFGRVALWGPGTLKGETGWRAKFAYPVKLYVLKPNPSPITAPEEVADRLAELYGVPCRALNCSLNDIHEDAGLARELA